MNRDEFEEYLPTSSNEALTELADQEIANLKSWKAKLVFLELLDRFERSYVTAGGS